MEVYSVSTEETDLEIHGVLIRPHQTSLPNERGRPCLFGFHFSHYYTSFSLTKLFQISLHLVIECVLSFDWCEC